MTDKFPRKYKRVPTEDEVDPNDIVAVQKARDQRVRDRAIDLQVLKIYKERMIQCHRREEVNYPQRCRTIIKDYMDALHHYKSHEWTSLHYIPRNHGEEDEDK